MRDPGKADLLELAHGISRAGERTGRPPEGWVGNNTAVGPARPRACVYEADSGAGQVAVRQFL